MQATLNFTNGSPFFEKQTLAGSASGVGNNSWERTSPDRIEIHKKNTYRNPFTRSKPTTLIGRPSQAVSSNPPFKVPVAEDKFEKAKKRVEQLCQNNDDADTPNQIARDLALEALDLFEENNILPSLINSTHDESLVFEFFINEDVYSIDFCNSGEILYLRKIKDQILEVFELSEANLKGAILEISHSYAHL